MIGLLFVIAYFDILSAQSAMQIEAFPKAKKAGKVVVLQSKSRNSVEADQVQSQPL